MNRNNDPAGGNRGPKTLAAIVLTACSLAACASGPGKAPAAPPEPKAAIVLERGTASLDLSAPGAGLSGVAFSDGALRLAPGATTGEYLSPIASLPLFNWLVPSWRAEIPGGSSVRIAFQAWMDGAWSAWYGMGTWSAKPASERSSDALGRVDVDTLILMRDARLLRCRITLAAGPGGESPVLFSAGFATRNYLSPRPPDKAGIAALPDIDLPVPSRSQMVEDPSISGRICSPTSLSMVLAARGVDLPTAAVAAGCYDNGEGIFGNWPFNVAFAGSRGLPARVDYFGSLSDIAAELSAGNLVVASVKFGPGELAGAPINSTSGHLMVVRGFAHRDGKTYALVNDPASPDVSGVPREYLAEQFAGAWTGVVYVIGKP